MTTIYLDNCSLQRPHDDQSQVRVQLEAQAVLAVITLFEPGKVELLSSESLYYEAERMPKPRRRKSILNLLAEIPHYVETTDSVVHKAEQYTAAGVKPLDALHLATAVEAGADYFCSCDDRLLKRAKGLETGSVQVVSPLELINALES